MTQQAGDEGHSGGTDGRTVVVGVKLDAQSRELLTWALVKVAQPGDRVIALHVLDSNGIYLAVLAWPSTSKILWVLFLLGCDGLGNAVI